MTELEPTRQQLDPVGTLPTRLPTVVLSAGALLYGIVMTIRSADQINNPLLAVLALAWLAGAALTVAIASSPYRAPFTSATHMAVILLVLGAIALSTASQWGSNRFIQDDFGPMSLGMLLLAMGVYRPATELASMGALAAIFVGFLTLLQVPALVSNAPPVSFVLVGMTPVLALSFASATFSGRLVSELEKQQRRALTSAAATTRRLTDGITQSVRRDRVRILDHDVFPFFEAILGKETVTDHDRARANEIAHSIRSLMVAEADRTWLEVVAADDGVTPENMSKSIVDDEGRATGMVAGQRTVLRAFIIALRTDTALVRESIKVTITGTKGKSRGVLTALIHKSESDPRDTYGPYFATMRVVFPELGLEYDNNKLTVRFSYEQR